MAPTCRLELKIGDYAARLDLETEKLNRPNPCCVSCGTVVAPASTSEAKHCLTQHSANRNHILGLR